MARRPSHRWTLPWPSDQPPRINVAGRFPHLVHHFDHFYRSATHALHLYDYPCRMKLAGRVIEIQPGDLTLSPAEHKSSYEMPHAGHHLCVHFWPPPEAGKQETGAALLVHLPLHRRLGPQREFAVGRLMTVIRWHAAAAHDPIARAAASAAMLEFLLWLAHAGADQPLRAARHADRAVEAVADLIEDQLDQPLRVPALAQQVGLSQNYLSLCFRVRFGQTINAYLLTRRVELARHLLTSTAMPIKQIAVQVGMADPHHFNKQFRRLTGQSPTACRAAGPPDRPLPNSPPSR